jgi:hypothetical protein
MYGSNAATGQPARACRRFRDLLFVRRRLSEIASDPVAVIGVGPAVMPAHELFLAQDLTMDEPCCAAEINQRDPVRKYQELARRHHDERHIDGIAAEGESAAGDQGVGPVGVNADAEALPEGNQAPQHQQERRKTEQHADPCDGFGLEESVVGDGRPLERSREYRVEIKESERQDHEIRLVRLSEFHGRDALLFQQKDTAQDHSEQENVRQRSQIFRHGSSPVDTEAVLPQRRKDSIQF